MKTKTIIKRAAAFLLSLVLVSGDLVPAEAHTHNTDCYCNGTISELSYIEEIDPTCTFCGGTGKSACEACNGTGKITTSVTTTHTHSTECYTWNKVSTVVTNKKMASVTSRKYASYNTNASATWSTFYKNASAMDSEDVKTYLPLSSMQPGDLVVVKGTLKAYRAQKGDYYPQLMVKYDASSGGYATMPVLNRSATTAVSQHTTFLQYALYTGSNSSSKAVLPSGSWLGEEAIRKLVQGKYSYGEWMFFKTYRPPSIIGDGYTYYYTYAPSDKLTINNSSYPAAQLTDEYLTYIADDCCGVDGALPIFTGSNKEIIPNNHNTSTDATIIFAGSGRPVADQWVYTNQDFIYAFPLSKLSSSVTFNYISVGINNSNTGNYIVPDGTYSVEIWRQQRVCGKTAGTVIETSSASCSACRGAGTFTCPVCDGTGTAYVCPDCGGTRFSRKNCEQCNGTGVIDQYSFGNNETKEVGCKKGFYVLPQFDIGADDMGPRHVVFEFDFTTGSSKECVVPKIRKSSSSSIILKDNNKYIENLQIDINGPAWEKGTYIYQNAYQTSHVTISFDFTYAGIATVTSKYKQLYFSCGSKSTIVGTITYPHAGVSLQKTTCPGCQGTKTFADTSKPCETCSATGTIKVDEPIIYHYTCNVCGEGDYSKAYYGQKCGRKLCADELEMEGACGHTRFAIGEYDTIGMSAEAREGILPYSSSDGTLVIEDVSYLNNGQKDCGAAYLGHCSVCEDPFTVTYYWPDELQTGSYSSSLADVKCVAPEVITPTELTLQIWGETNVLDVREETEISGVFPLADKATSEDDVVILFASSATSAASTVGLLLNTGEELISLYDALENGIISELSYASLNVSADEAYALTEGSGELPSGSTLALRFCMAKNCAGLTAYTDRDSDSGSSDIVISVKKNDVHTELEWTPIKKAPDVRQSQKNVSQTITRYMTDGVLTSTSSSDTPATVYIPTAEYRIGNIVLDDTAHFRYETRMVGGDAEIKVFIKANSGCSNNAVTVLRLYDTNGYARNIITLTAKIATKEEELTTLCSVVFNIDGAETPVNVNKGSLIPASDVPDVHVPSDLVEDHMTTTYSFDGWYTSSNYSGVYDLSSPVTSDLSLYGRIESETYVTPSYTVTFVVNGHEISSQTVYEREGAVEPSVDEINAYVPAGNVFRKWDKSFSYITEDTVITARFQQIISPENQLADADGEYDCLVRASIGATYLVSIPKKIVLDGGTGLGSYRITVDADLGGMDYISVRPLPSSAEGFVLKEAGGKRDAYFNVYQPKQYFISSATKYPEFISHTGEYVSVSGSAISLSNDCGFDTENGEGMTADATVSANISAGTWKGIVTFEIFLGEKNIG